MMLYFVLFKNKKEEEFRMFTNLIFDKENDAEEFAKKSMKRGLEFKVVEYNKKNFESYWYK
jgi:hypothetical protein